jgi:hypothetical protein
MGRHAELLADGGATGSSSDFFRSEGFLRAENVTHSLVIENDRGRTALPILVRDIPGTSFRDGISPYGYPGGIVDGDAPGVDGVDLTVTGLVSVFIRERLGPPSLRGGTARGMVLVHDPAVARRRSDSFSRDVRRNERLGYKTELLAGNQVDDTTLRRFHQAYTDTMRWVRAERRYFFSLDYVGSCLSSDMSWLCVVNSPDGGFAAGELVVHSDEMLHSYLAGTVPGLRSQSPGKNAVARLIEFSDSLGVPINFGGGLAAGDSLEAAKGRYSNSRYSFITHELICDSVRYVKLSENVRSDAFFPAYRRREAEM